MFFLLFGLLVLVLSPSSLLFQFHSNLGPLVFFLLLFGLLVLGLSTSWSRSTVVGSHSPHMRTARGLASLLQSTVVVSSVGRRRTGVAWLFWFFSFLGCRSMAFGSSSPCTCLTKGLSVVFRLFSAVGATADGRHMPFRGAWLRACLKLEG
jgi:uncharacterized membrane protein